MHSVPTVIFLQQISSPPFFSFSLLLMQKNGSVRWCVSWTCKCIDRWRKNRIWHKLRWNVETCSYLNLNTRWLLVNILNGSKLVLWAQCSILSMTGYSASERVNSQLERTSRTKSPTTEVLTNKDQLNRKQTARACRARGHPSLLPQTHCAPRITVDYQPVRNKDHTNTKGATKIPALTPQW